MYTCVARTSAVVAVGIGVSGLLSGCFICADGPYGYEVYARLLDATTLEPLREALVSITLSRDGEPLEAWGGDYRRAEYDGRVSLYYNMGLIGTCTVLLLFSSETPDESPLGEPPDEVAMLITTDDGYSRLVIALDEQHLEQPIDTGYGVPTTGIIQLGDVMVDMRPWPPDNAMRPAAAGP